ncbi:MAG: hypothetical protein JNL30_10170 [Rubrivivax sp.]|nr:hypothetical protein [Rubrivivax sp.]
MRVFTTGIATETNTFAATPTGLAAFEALGIRRRGRPGTVTSRRGWQSLPRMVAALLATTAAVATEPPERPGLACAVVKQSLADALTLEVRFTNETTEPMALPPGAHLVLYQDAAATEAMEVTARADRIQRTPLALAPNGRTTADLFAITAANAEALLCQSAGRPAAAMGLYFYEFSRRPTFRCVLRGAAPASLPMKVNCASTTSATASASTTTSPTTSPATSPTASAPTSAAAPARTR